MGELVEFIAKALVDNPDEVSVNEVEGSQSIIIELKVASEDMGKIIGKQGRIAKAIRTVVQASSYINDNKRIDKISLFLSFFYFFTIASVPSNNTHLVNK